MKLSQSSPIVLRSLEKPKVRLQVILQLLKVFNEKTHNVFRSLKLLSAIKQRYETIFGEKFLTKLAKVDGRYFWRLAAPGFPSLASYKMHQNEANRFIPTKPFNGQRSVLMAITKKCPLNCEHCFEWPNLSKQEALSVDQWISIIRRYQEFGTTQIMLSGGEPMVRINDVYKMLGNAHPGTDFWVITSGIGLNNHHAQKLKQHGLTGVMISLDHHKKELHDQFRGYDGAFDAVIEAVTAANRAKLVTTLSLCTTKAFTTVENIEQYMELAKRLGVSFVQLVEPKPKGRYAEKDVLLDKNQITLLDQTYLKYNNEKGYRDYPIINYLGYHQRQVGCFGAGDRFFYIDTDGDAHICPFCEKKVINTLEESAEDVITILGENKCHFHEPKFNKTDLAVTVSE